MDLRGPWFNSTHRCVGRAESTLTTNVLASHVYLSCGVRSFPLEVPQTIPILVTTKRENLVNDISHHHHHIISPNLLWRQSTRAQQRLTYMYVTQ